MRISILLILLAFVADVHAAGDSFAFNKYIVLPNEPKPAEKTAATELEHYLSKISGQEFQIIPESGVADLKKDPSGFVWIGRTTKLENEKLPLPGKDHEEEWMIQVTANGLFLVGGGQRGTLYAAYHFLEDVLKVHWWTPWGEESVPKEIAEIGSHLSLRGEPKLFYRDIADGLEADLKPKHFFARNRINGRYGFLGLDYGGMVTYGSPYLAHTMGVYLPAADYFKDHPEYFSLIGGERQKNNPDLTNPEVIEIFREKLKKWAVEDKEKAAAAGNSAPVLYDISYNDIDSYDEGPQSKALIDKYDTYAAPLVAFLNELAPSLKSVRPDAQLTTLSYQWTQKPPLGMALADNIAVRLCTVQNSFAAPLDSPINRPLMDDLNGWKTMTDKLILWDYGLAYSSTAGPGFTLFTLIDSIKTMARKGVKGYFYEHELLFPSTPFSNHLWELKTWIAAKLMENPDANADDLIKTFSLGYYEKGGPAIFKYLKLLEREWDKKSAYHAFNASVAAMNHLTLPFFQEAFAYFDEAEAATSDPEIKQRIAHARLGLDRAFIFKAAGLRDEYVAKGGTESKIPLAVDKAYDRCLAVLDALPHPRFPEPPTAGEAERVSLSAIKNAFQEKFPPLPEAFQRSEWGKSFAVIGASEFRIIHTVSYEIIPPLAVVLGLIKPTEKDAPPVNNLKAGFFDAQSRKEKHRLQLNGGAVNTAKAFGWEKLGTFDLKASDWLWLGGGWDIQVDLGGVIPPDGNPHRCDVWVEYSYQPDKTEDGNGILRVSRVLVAVAKP